MQIEVVPLSSSFMELLWILYSLSCSLNGHIGPPNYANHMYAKYLNFLVWDVPTLGHLLRKPSPLRAMYMRCTCNHPHMPIFDSPTYDSLYMWLTWSISHWPMHDHSLFYFFYWFNFNFFASSAPFQWIPSHIGITNVGGTCMVVHGGVSWSKKPRERANTYNNCRLLGGNS